MQAIPEPAVGAGGEDLPEIVADILDREVIV